MYHLHPESIYLKESSSLRNSAPENPERIGARNVNMVASDNDRRPREKYIPARPMKLEMALSNVRRTVMVYPTLKTLEVLTTRGHPLDQALGLESSAIA
jgi:hypothetical protein